MKSVIYWVIFVSLFTGCTSTGQVSTQLSKVLKTTTVVSQPTRLTTSIAPSHTEATELVTNQTRNGVVLSAYDRNLKGYTLSFVDPATGEDIPGFEPIRISLGTDNTPQGVYSLDGGKLAVVESQGEVREPFAGGTSFYPRATTLHIVDLTSWQAISSTLPADGWLGAVVFNPAGDRLALGYNSPKYSKALVVDTSDGRIVSELALGFRPEKIAFDQDGNDLLAYGSVPSDNPGVTQPGPLRLETYSVSTGEKLWERDLKDVINGFWCLEGCESEHGQQLYANWAPAIVLAPNGNFLYIYHADRDRLTRISLADGSREDIEVQEAQSWIERLLAVTAGVALAKGGAEGTTRQGVISPDGKRLYVLSTTTHSEVNKDGFWEPTDVVTELQVIDPQNGQIIARKPENGYGIRLSPDGKFLLIDDWLDSGMQSEILNAESLESIAGSDGWQLVYAPDMEGKTVLLGRRGSNNFALFDAESFQLLKSWKYRIRAYWASSP